MTTGRDDNPSVKNQRFLPPPFAQGRLWRDGKPVPYEGNEGAAQEIATDGRAVLAMTTEIGRGEVLGRHKKISKENILNELVAVGFARVTNYLFVENGEILLKDGKKLSPNEAAAICQIEKTASGVKVKFYDKLKALELLGKAVGLFGGASLPDDASVGIMEAVLSATREEVGFYDAEQKADTCADLVE